MKNLKPQILRAGISGKHFWARRYAASTVGFELEQVRQSIREQEPRIEQTDGSEPVTKGALQRDA